MVRAKLDRREEECPCIIPLAERNELVDAFLRSVRSPETELEGLRDVARWLGEGEAWREGG